MIRKICLIFLASLSLESYAHADWASDLSEQVRESNERAEEAQQEADDRYLMDLGAQNAVLTRGKGLPQGKPAFDPSKPYQVAPKHPIDREPDHFCVHATLYDFYGKPRGVREDCY